MSDGDLRFMSHAIEWAEGNQRIPKVGAIIVAKGGEVIGRGRRGTEIEGDDKHAEQDAIDEAKDKTKLAGSTIHTWNLARARGSSQRASMLRRTNTATPYQES